MPVSGLRVLGTSFWVLYRVSRAALRQRLGGPLSSLLNVFFFLGIAVQTGALIIGQTARLRAQLARGLDPAGSAAALFVLDVLGVLVLLPPALIRADGIAGKRRAAVDTELWLTLPLSGAHRILARLGQATFFLTFLSFFLLSHFLGPALAFAPRLPLFAPLFLCLAGSALLLSLGGGAAGYALIRRYLPPFRQGQLIAWTSLGLLPLAYSFFGVAPGRGGALAGWLGEVLSGSPVAVLLRAAHAGDLPGAIRLGAALLLVSSAVFLGGFWLSGHLGREAVDDIAPLLSPRRYVSRGAPRPLSHLRKDLLLRWRDPSHRGALLGSGIAAFLILLIEALSGGRLLAGADPRAALSLCCFAAGMAVLISAGQWLPLEARTLDWLRVSGVEPEGLLLRKGLCASVEALLLCLPVSALLLRRGLSAGSLWHLPALWLFALSLCWFLIGDTAARFPQARRDTRPVQFRSLYAGYLVMLAVSVALPTSPRVAAAALLLLLLCALSRLDAGIFALLRLDEPPEPLPRELRLSDAWLPGTAAAILQGVTVLFLREVRPLSAPLPALLASAAAAVVLGPWSAAYLRARGGPRLPALLTILPPVAGELYFRGWLLAGLERRLGRGPLTLLLSAVFFLLLHPAMPALPTLLLGLGCGLLYRHSGSLIPGIALHALFEGSLFLWGRR